MEFTTTDAIARRLRGRLEIQGQMPAFGSNLGASQIDVELLDQVGNQVEADFNAIAKMIYVWPPPVSAIAARQIVAGIIERLVISELAQTHFQQSQSPEMGGDAGFGAVMRKQAFEQIQKYFGGHGIFIPGATEPTEPAQPILLPDVPLLDHAPDTITRNTTLIGHRRTAESATINWGF